MTLQKGLIYGGVAGLLAGAVIVGSVAVIAVNSNNQDMMKMMGMNTTRMKDDRSGHMGMSMNDMSYELQSHSGDSFDENFVAMMIAHHQGAIDMAKLAETRAKHDEVKQLSKEIISAQTKEIETMRQWQQEWGYGQDNSDNSMHTMH